MIHSIHSRTRAIAACFGFVLLLCAAGLRAQEPWPPSSLVPPDTTTYQVSTEYGAIQTERRPPDSLVIPGQLLIRFRQGALDSAKRMSTFWEYFYGHRAKQKGAEPLGAPFGGSDSPRGWPVPLRELLFAERFGLDSANNVVKDSTLTSFLLSEHGHTLQRLTTASPLDTLSVTRDGDTIGCDHANWMILNMDSTTNPLLLSGLLMALYPHDIIEAYPCYTGVVLLGHVPGNTSFHCQIGDTMIHTPMAWDYEVGDTNILVALYDKSVNYRHPGFLDSVVGKGHKFVFAWDYGADSNNTLTFARPDDHGTACMGVIALQTNRNSTTPTGIAGGWGPLAGGTDTIERGRGASMVILADERTTVPMYVAAIFEASARSPSTAYGLGVHAINTSAAITTHPYTPVHAAANYAFENGVVQVAANNEYPPGGTEEQAAYPADYDPSWMICVGDYDENKARVASCDYGYSLDMLAPSGDPSGSDGCGFPNLNWTTRDTGITPHYFYGGYGGTSIAAPNVTGSAALLLSTFYRRDTAHLMHIEPEDIERILEASAWRGDADRDTLTTRDTWRKNSGFGYLDIGTAYQMMDTTLSIKSSNYRLYHYSITDTSKMTFTDWAPDTGAVMWFFDVPTDSRANAHDSFGKYRERSYLLNYCGDRESYMVQHRTVTAKMVLPDTLERTDATPMFAWGRSGGQGAKSGWSLAQENFQTGFSEVINGTGGDDTNDSYEEGIFHNNDTIIVQTYQYWVAGYDTLDGQYDIYLGHCPRDTSLGLNFSVFARPKILNEAVKEESPQSGDALEVLLDAATNTATAYYNITTPIHDARIEIYDDLGQLVAWLPRVSANIGKNQMQLPVSALASGVYLCRLSGKNYSQSKAFSIVK